MTHTTRRRILTLAFAALAAMLCAVASPALPARADVAMPAPTVHIRGQQTSFTTGRHPTHASFEIENSGRETSTLFLYRAILRDGSNYPMRITRVTVDGADAQSTVSVRPGQTIRLVVFFDVPDTLSARASYEIHLRPSVTAGGGFEQTAAVVSRAHRDPARKWFVVKLV